jgi:hypothetical protein
MLTIFNVIPSFAPMLPGEFDKQPTRGLETRVSTACGQEVPGTEDVRGDSLGSLGDWTWAISQRFRVCFAFRASTPAAAIRISDRSQPIQNLQEWRRPTVRHPSGWRRRQYKEKIRVRATCGDLSPF